MGFKNVVYKLIILIILIASGGENCYAITVKSNCWQDFGRQVIYFLGSNRCPPALWMESNESLLKIFDNPNSTRNIIFIERFLEQALKNYERNKFILYSRMPLNKNPKCILGFYLTERFPETRSGDFGKRLFVQAVERSCLMEFGTEVSWKQKLESEFVKIEKNSTRNFCFDSFGIAELPFLLKYLATNGSSGKIQRQAGLFLAKHLAVYYGAEPALRQYQRPSPGQEYITAKLGSLSQWFKTFQIKQADLEELANKESNLPSEFLQNYTDKINNLLFLLAYELRDPTKQLSKKRISNYASEIYLAINSQNTPTPEINNEKADIIKLYQQTKKQYTKQVLFAEYNLAKIRIAKDKAGEFLKIEPILFASQISGRDSLEKFRGRLNAVTPENYRQGQMYRFAKFAQQIKSPFMIRMALDIASQQLDDVCDNIQLFKNVAEMHLKYRTYQKAIEIYERIAGQVCDNAEAEEAQFIIIKLYSEQLKFYDKATSQCYTFLRKFPNSQRLSYMKFLIGKLAYLMKDYPSAVGQLDSFVRKHPGDPQVSEANMLAALSRMYAGETEDAIERFIEIIQKHPEGELAARSKFLIGYAQISEQKYSEALETFRQLLEQFPESKYVKQAQNFIDRLHKVSQ